MCDIQEKKKESPPHIPSAARRLILPECTSSHIYTGDDDSKDLCPQDACLLYIYASFCRVLYWNLYIYTHTHTCAALGDSLIYGTYLVLLAAQLCGSPAGSDLLRYEVACKADVCACVCRVADEIIRFHLFFH